MEEIVSGELFKWSDTGKEGLTLDGILKSYVSRPSQTKGPGNLYEVITKDGIIPFFAPTLLHKKLSDVPIGYCVMIKQEETSKTKDGNPLKNVAVKRGEVDEKNLKAVCMEGYEPLEEVVDQQVGILPPFSKYSKYGAEIVLHCVIKVAGPDHVLVSPAPQIERTYQS